MLEQSSHPWLVATTSASSLIALLFDIPAGAIFAALSGGIIGIMLSEAMTAKKAVLMVSAVVTASAYLSPLAIRYIGDYPIRGVCFVIALLLSWDKARAFIKDRILAFTKSGDPKELKP